MSEAIAAGYPQGHPLAPAAATKPRVWPGVIIILLQWSAMIVPSLLMPGDFAVMYGFMAGIYGGALAVLVWWIFFSRVGWGEVGIGALAIVACVAAVYVFGDPSMQSMGGMPILFYALPMVTTAMVVGLAITPFLNWPVRRAVMLVAMAGVAVFYCNRRLEGMDGSFRPEWQWRFAVSDEDKFFASRKAAPKAAAPNTASPAKVETQTAGDWPEFRGGPARDSIVHGVVIDTNWEKTPPKLLWKQRVGKGWSSFAAVGDRLFTQEQRGPDEVVVCYDAATGNEIWAHTDTTRFTELIGGPGPRATPTFHQGKIYAQGATGILNCLDAATGTKIWSRNIKDDYKLKIPIWGFSASPLVHAGIVTVYGGKVEDPDNPKATSEGKAVLAYDALTGDPKWNAGTGDHSYCSTQLSKIDGVEQILVATNDGVYSLDPITGKQLWLGEWKLKEGMARVVQPAVIGNDVILGAFIEGTCRFHVERGDQGWKANEVWKSRDFKPYYNDFVVYQDHAYGFDGPIFVCVDLKTGKRKWGERGYGNGEVLLLAAQGVLLVQAETGEVALAEASPAEHKQLAQIPGIEGKTWNHPTLVHDRLYIRNGQEAACFQVKTAGK